jgi:hypothetical protein
MSSSPSGAAAIGSKHDELRLLFNSRNPIITVKTAEEERLAHLLTAIAVELCVPMYAWSVTAGLARIAGEPIYGTAQPEQALTNIAQIRGDAIFLLKDFARYCNNDKICRMLRDLADAFRSVRRSIVISALSLNLPPEIVSESAPFAFGLPDANELATGVKRVLAEMGRDLHITVSFDAASVRRLAENLAGLKAEEAMRTLRKCLLARGKADAGLADVVMDARRSALQTEGLLEPLRRDASFADVARCPFCAAPEETRAGRGCV